MKDNQQISEVTMLSRFQVGTVLLPPLVVKFCTVLGGNEKADARIKLALPGEPEEFCFVVELKARATPQTIQLAMAQAKSATKAGEWPMIQVPYLRGASAGAALRDALRCAEPVSRFAPAEQSVSRPLGNGGADVFAASEMGVALGIGGGNPVSGSCFVAAASIQGGAGDGRRFDCVEGRRSHRAE